MRSTLIGSLYILLFSVICEAQLFLPPVNCAVGTAPRCMVSKDFNGDGKLDIATSDWGGNTVSIILPLR